MSALDVVTGIPHRMTKGLLALWLALIVIVVASFAVLLYYGSEIYQMAPPVPEAISTTEGEVVFTGKQIRKGQDIWRSVGGRSSVRCGGTLHIRPLTGPPTGSTGKPRG